MSQQGQQVFGGRYELHRRLARGGMADVYLARDSLLDRPVALKVLFPEFAADPSFVQRFRREAQAAANLSHPNIVSVYDWGEEGGTYFIVMEYVEGRSLAEIIRTEGSLLPDRAADITADIAAALSFAHRNGVIHRDVKPGNVLISPSGQVKVTDFGIARAVTTQENLTQTGTVMGTATYFSPEQAQGSPVDPRSDVYSLGVVLYEMLCGRPPFSGDSPVAVAYKHVQEPPRPPRELTTHVPEPLEAVTMKALAKNPANRYASAEDFRADLRRFREGRPVFAESLLPVGLDATVAQPAARTTAQSAYGSETRVVRREEPVYEEPRRRTGPFIAVLVVLLLLLGGLIALLVTQLDLGGDTTPQVAVPTVVGLSEDDARQQLENARFTVKVDRRANDTAPEGEVFDQDPDAGVRIDEGSSVTIAVSSGAAPIEVPDVVGLNESDATSSLSNSGLVANVVREPNEDVPEGEVFNQDPAAGDEIPRGDTVTIAVSSGPPEVEVPDVTGRPENEALGILQDAGFRISRDTEASSEIEEGHIIRTEPGAHELARKGSTVVMVVSTGAETVDVPDVVGDTEQQARSQLEAAGFTVQVARQATTDENEDGIVLDQDPAGGEQAKEGSAVQITVGEFQTLGGGGKAGVGG